MTLFTYPTDPLRVLSILSRTEHALRLSEGAAPEFLAKQLVAQSYDRRTLFISMATQTPTLFSDFPAPIGQCLAGDYAANDVSRALIDSLSSSRAADRYKVRFGSFDSVQYLTVREIMLRWCASRTVLGITDLPVRGGELASVFDQEFLGFCNLIPLSSKTIRRLEMLTAVISKAGKLTDSHSDDLAVCNHCFIGRKLWFVWSTAEGICVGLEDAGRGRVCGRARFDLERFLSLESARWFFVGPGETIFLPGMFTHRVYTVEDYIGVGSFYVTLPNVLHTASRWLLHGSLWDPEHISDARRPVDYVLHTAIDKLRALEHSRAHIREQWGYQILPIAVRHWENTLSTETAKLQKTHRLLGKVASAAASAA